jgi:hypothetical protein
MKDFCKITPYNGELLQEPLSISYDIFTILISLSVMVGVRGFRSTDFE